MATKTLADIAEKMRKLDIAMLTTETSRGQFASRPMSNNGDVAYDGNSYFFTYDGSRTVQDIEKNPHVGLTFEGPSGSTFPLPAGLASFGTSPRCSSTGCPTWSAGSRTASTRPASS